MRKHPNLRNVGGIVAAVALICALIAALYVFEGDDMSNEDIDDAWTATASETFTLTTDGVLTVAISPDNPPFEDLEDGEYVGLSIDIATAIAESLGLEVEFTTMQRNDIITAIAAGGQADMAISGFTVNEKRAEKIDFTDSYYTDDLAIAAMSGSGVTEDNVGEVLNQEGIIIAVESGSAGESYCQENFPEAKTIAFDDTAGAFDAMQAMQADFICASLIDVKPTVEDANSDFEIVQSIATGEDYAMVVSQDNPGLTEVINIVLAELVEEGVIDELIEEWL